jgi:hypothetical protein
MNNIERDKQRIVAYYYRSKIHFDSENGIFDKYWFSIHNCFLEDLTDLSEEFHRHYCSLYQKGHWRRIAEHQNCLPEQFYVDFVDWFDNVCKVDLIRYGKVSSKFIEDNIELFPPEIWEKVYQ